MLNAGDEEYYLGLSGTGPVRPDEYYLTGPEEPGRWVGSGSVALGLAGEVAGDDLRAVLEGADPGSGELLVSAAAAAKRSRPGMYMTFSAPKGVSLLGLVADDDIAAVVREAHAGAVADALGHLERNALYARRGRNGVERVSTGGFVAAAFDHKTSREGDPQLHTHVLAANVVQGADGRWTAMDSSSMFSWARTAGFVYQAALRRRLTEELGIEWGPVRQGMAEPRGIPKAVLRDFSTRRRQIEDRMDETGTSSARSAQVAALNTRRAKDQTVTAAVLRESWRLRADSLGMGTERLRRVVGRGREVRPLADGLAAEIDRLVAPTGLTAQASTFGRADITRALAEAAPNGATVEELEAAVEAVLADERVVHLTAGEDVRATPGDRRFTTTDLFDVEAHLYDTAVRAEGTWRAVATPARLDQALADRPTLSDEQREAVRRLAGGSDGVAVLVGRAGAGKTFALDAARAAWTGSGVRVVGAAPTARAAAELSAGSGIPSTTLARLLQDAQRPEREGGGLPRGGVVVVDEAGMAGTRTLARLADLAEASGTKLVLVGDPAQLPEIDAGGSFAKLAARPGTAELSTNRRQVQAWERAALDDLRAGRATEALDVYRDHGRLVLADTAPDARTAMVGDWWQATQAGDRTAMFAVRRTDVDALNRLARQMAADHGHLTGPDLVVEDGPKAGLGFAVGDQVVALRNDRRLGLVNGTQATITGIDHTRGDLTITTGQEEGERVVPADYLNEGHLDHGYAFTVHKGQGVTVDRAFLLGSDTLYREAGYVGMSRGRASNNFYLVADDSLELDVPHHARPAERGLNGTVAAMADHLQTSRAQQRATDTGLPDGQATLADLHTRRAALAEQLRTAPDEERGRLRAGWDAVGEAIAERGDRLTRAALAAPPTYLVDRLGQPPLTGIDRARWAQAAGEIESYRDRFTVTGPDTGDGLGGRPEEPMARLAWDHTQKVMHRAGVDLGLDADLEREQELVMARRGGLGLGL